MQVHIWRCDVAPREWRWNACAQEYDLDVPVGSGATPLKAIEDLLWLIDVENVEPEQCSIRVGKVLMNAIAKPQPHADVAATALRNALATANAPLREAVARYRTAYAGLAADADLLDMLRAAGGLVLAAEAIVAASKQVEATARTTLAQTLMDTGACSIRSATHTFSASPGRQSVTITSAADVPAHLLHQPPPSPDKTKILRLLKAGKGVPGCEISNGGQPILTVKAISS
jgi:hypothetical protein